MNRPTSVYMLYDDYTQLTKIGVSSAVSERRFYLQTQTPGELWVVGEQEFSTTDEALRVEALIHKFFEAFHVRNSWYRIGIPVERR